TYSPYGRGKPPPGGFAVVTWIHPGNFTSGDPKIWNPYTLVHRQRIIFVTLSYRLNIMGFFTSLDAEAAGNFGLLDQQAAIQWVKNNIKEFGGNPDNICLMGYGSGGTSVALHMVNSVSRSLFSSAIIMSGGIFNTNTLRTPKDDEQFIDDLVGYYGCLRTPSSAMMECLRNVDGKSLVKYTEDFNWRPLIESYDFHNGTLPFITEPLKNYFIRGDFERVPLLTGYTNMEYVLHLRELIEQDLSVNATEEYLVNLLPEIANWDLPPINESDSCSYNLNHITDSIMFCYRPAVPIKDTEILRKLVIDFATEKKVAASTFQLASYTSSKNQETFMYRFDMKPSTPLVLERLPDWASVPHLFDLIYVWGIPYWSPLPTRQEWDVRDKRTSDIIMLFWTNFAKYSNPAENFPYPIRWDRFTPENPGILIIDRTFNMSDPSRLNYKVFEFWNDYYPKVVDIATQCCNATDAS
ncbi:esterase, partial [Oryctes borbonicus]